MIRLFLIPLCILFSFSHVLFAGEKAAQIFEQYNFSNDEAAAFFNKFPELETIEIASELKGELPDKSFSLKLYAENSNDVYIIQKTDAQMNIEKTYVPFEVNTRNFEGEIHGTLFETLQKDLGNEKMARQIAEAFKEDFMTTRGLRVPAAYTFDVIQYYDQDHLVKYGNVVKASLIIGKAIVEKVLQQDFETLKWNLLPLIPETNDRPFYAPVKSSRVSSLFQLSRRHPVIRRRIQPHNGIDFVARAGTPVFPALEGEIIAIGKARAKGKFILIQHDNGYQTTYDHLRKFSKGLRVGSRVEMNEAIGEVGRTGYATGAHLHFGVIKDGFYVNPLYLVKDYGYDEKELRENENGDLFEAEDTGDLSE